MGVFRGSFFGVRTLRRSRSASYPRKKPTYQTPNPKTPKPQTPNPKPQPFDSKPVPLKCNSQILSADSTHEPLSLFLRSRWQRPTIPKRRECRAAEAKGPQAGAGDQRVEEEDLDGGCGDGAGCSRCRWGWGWGCRCRWWRSDPER